MDFSGDELSRINDELRKMALENGEMLRLREASKTDDEFLDKLAVACKTSLEMMRLVATYTFLPIGGRWHPGSSYNEQYRG